MKLRCVTLLSPHVPRRTPTGQDATRMERVVCCSVPQPGEHCSAPGHWGPPRALQTPQAEQNSSCSTAHAGGSSIDGLLPSPQWSMIGGRWWQKYWNYWDFFPCALEFILIRKSKHVDRPWLCCESNELILLCLLRSAAQTRFLSGGVLSIY